MSKILFHFSHHFLCDFFTNNIERTFCFDFYYDKLKKKNTTVYLALNWRFFFCFQRKKVIFFLCKNTLGYELNQLFYFTPNHEVVATSNSVNFHCIINKTSTSIFCSLWSCLHSEDHSPPPFIFFRPPFAWNILQIISLFLFFFFKLKKVEWLSKKSWVFHVVTIMIVRKSNIGRGRLFSTGLTMDMFCKKSFFNSRL